MAPKVSKAGKTGKAGGTAKAKIAGKKKSSVKKSGGGEGKSSADDSSMNGKMSRRAFNKKNGNLNSLKNASTSMRKKVMGHLYKEYLENP